MISFIEKIDHSLAIFIKENIKNPNLDFVLSRINRGETLGILVVVFFIIIEISHNKFWAILYAGFVTYLTDRFVLIIKKSISRKRPMKKISESNDPNPDMSHSFPSAHSANSMVAVVILMYLFGFPKLFYVFTFLAGIGRLFSLHHFLSDIIGGWLIGLGFGMSAVYLGKLLF